jgi:hypothetical protein
MKGENILEEFICTIKKSINCKEVLENSSNLYNLRKYKITEIPESNVIQMYQHIVEKYKLFIWINIDFIKIIIMDNRVHGLKIN